ncbi:hypothetical protein [Mycoplasma sp. 'Moose RK']|uniref:hypothetical protein n=1 Tax=Mycoplasma sp. 'Moose RK' TaxID=2780095 RepID=UPI0018C29626|nr:hypothetical protein [Mycoplasma sp. 'Moose RK']MBG0730487.1 hypothetical protein [Mycoplasma sp. 'Moose RK']MBG0730743.1 hypothetical protein [Mycoplasma sp. 'Moose RK']
MKIKKENNLNILQEKLKILQESDTDTLKELKKLLLSELEAEILTRKQQIELIDKLIKNNEKTK